MLLTGCGAQTELAGETISTEDNVTQETLATEAESETVISQENDTNVINEISNVTPDQLKQVTKNVDTILQDGNWEELEKNEFIILDSVEDDVVLYGRGSGESMVLRVRDEIFAIDECWLSPRVQAPQLYVQDMDQDGKVEYIIQTHTKTGTGVSGDDLYVIEAVDGTFVMHEFTEDDWLGQLLEHISWEYDKEWQTVQTYVDGERADASLILTNFLKENQASFGDLSFGDIMEFIYHDEQWYLWVRGGIIVTDWATPQYEYGIDVLAPFSYTTDGTFTLDKVELTARDDVDRYSNPF